MRILIVTDGSPYPIVSYEAVRIHNLVRHLAREHQVWLAALVYSPEQVEGVLHMEKFCCGVEAAVYQRRHPVAHLPVLLRYALAGRPPELVFHRSIELARKINRLASTVDFDVVQIEHSYNALYLKALPPDRHCKRILVFRNVVFDQYARIFRVEWRPVRKIRALLYSAMMRRWEPRYAQRFDRCIALSKADRRLLVAFNPQLRIDVVPNGTNTELLRPLPVENAVPALLFVGTMNYTANADAAVYFVREILPRIRQKIKDVEMWIVGREPLPEVRALIGDIIHVTGRVEDVVPYYRQSAVSVVPLRAGSGTRLKILESMALGRPIVSTTLGCEGLDVADGEHLLIADSPEQFAESTVRLLTDRALYQHITTSARQLVVNRYDWNVIARQLLDIYSEMTR